MGVPFQEFRHQIPKTFLCISCILPDSKIKCNRRGEKNFGVRRLAVAFKEKRKEYPKTIFVPVKQEPFLVCQMVHCVIGTNFIY